MSDITVHMFARLRLISPFRWRLEWAVLLIAASAGILSEQAREARERDPYIVVSTGRTAQAVVTAARDVVIPLKARRGVPQQETRTFLDLEWIDAEGNKRRVESYRLEPETIAALGIDTKAGRWPAYAQILYLDNADTPPRRIVNSLAIIEQGATSLTFQTHCHPWRYCRVVALSLHVLTPAEEAALNVDYVLDRAPHALTLSLALLALLLTLRLAGLVHNRPSLE